ncbi:MacB-like periplasmic core domain protein [uncultured archaeon]|nr:MacB-like periplasmic core domain protein [uncultured archaeon]
MIKDYFKLATKNLKKRKLQSWLTLLGILISIATIFMLISLSLGLENAVQEQFRSLGTDKFFIFAKGSMESGGIGSNTAAVQLTLNDINTIEKVQGVKQVTYMNTGNGKIEFNKKIRYAIVIGIPLDNAEIFKAMSETSSFKIDQGRLFKETDKKKIMIGSKYAEENTFGKKVGIKDKLLINGEEFEVVGILQSVGNPSDDQNIYMSFSDFKLIYNSGERVDQVIVQVNPNENLSDVAKKVEKKLRSARGVTEKTQDFEILTPEELLQSVNSILSIITGFLLSVAAISLIVGSIGIANTMYTSVLERTREIGVMKAIGAKNLDVMFIFLIESGLLGLLGGILGVVVGLAIGKVIEVIAVQQLGTTLLRIGTPWYLFVGCLVFSFIVGVLSGLIPAWQASKTKVVDALRYE